MGVCLHACVRACMRACVHLFACVCMRTFICRACVRVRHVCVCTVHVYFYVFLFVLDCLAFMVSLYTNMCVQLNTMTWYLKYLMF